MFASEEQVRTVSDWLEVAVYRSPSPRLAHSSSRRQNLSYQFNAFLQSTVRHSGSSRQKITVTLSLKLWCCQSDVTLHSCQHVADFEMQYLTPDRWYLSSRCVHISTRKRLLIVGGLMWLLKVK